MELTGKKFENYHSQRTDTNKEAKLETISLKDLRNMVLMACNTAELNHKSIDEIPIFVTNRDRQLYPINFVSECCGNLGMTVQLDISDYTKLEYVAPDSKPENGEYWKSRGASSDDVSGFVVSKKAGMRLLHLVKYILGEEEIKTYLDYRDYEPDWIQFKFSADEFDCELLDKLSTENNGILTEEIIRKCVKKC